MILPYGIEGPAPKPASDPLFALVVVGLGLVVFGVATLASLLAFP